MRHVAQLEPLRSNQWLNSSSFYQTSNSCWQWTAHIARRRRSETPTAGPPAPKAESDKAPLKECDPHIQSFLDALADAIVAALLREIGS
jgi:hypothetical protein